MRGVALALVATAALACGGAGAPGLRATVTRSQCAVRHYWDGEQCRPRGDGAAVVARASTLLADFKVDAALALLDGARAAGPYLHRDHVELYEQLGIAYAYLGKESEASAAFAMLLTISPGHLLSYTLSPKVTFLFERVRKSVGASSPVLDLSWPRAPRVTEPVPVEVEVVGDPQGLLARATVHFRRKGEGEFAAADVELAAPGEYRRLVLPASSAKRAEVLQLYVTAFDSAGNEVLLWAGADEPREIALRYDRPRRWYEKWWVWVVAGGVVAAGTGGAVYLVGQEPSETIGGVLDIAR